MSPAKRNAVFELCAVLLSWHSVWRALRETPQGVSWAYIALSGLWALNAIPYYRGHGERVSMWCALGRSVANLCWCWSAL